MRVAKKDKTEIDLMKPVNIDSFDLREDDCFGREWDMTTKACQSCADNEVCGIIFGKKVVKPRIEKIAESQGIHFLDEMDFTLIDEEELRGKLDGENVAVIFDFIKKTAKASDDIAVKEYLVNFLKTNGFGIENSVIYKKDA